MSETLKPRASNAERWINCPASFKLEQPYPDESNEAAERGTRLHEAVHTGNMEGLSEADLTAVKTAKDTCTRLIDGAFGENFMEGEAFIEVQLEGEFFTGKPDFVFVRKGKALIVDFKFGSGMVKTSGNPQLSAYAQLVRKAHPEVEIVLGAIIQADQEPYVWVIPKIDIESFAKKALYGDEPPKCGAWCKYCKHRANCVETQSSLMKIVNSEIIANPETSLEQIPAAELTALLDACQVAEMVMPKIYAEAVKRLAEGASLGGWKLPKGRKLEHFKEGVGTPEIYNALLADYPLSDILPALTVSIPKLRAVLDERDTGKLDALIDTTISEVKKPKC